MEFYTRVPVNPQEQKIDHASKVLLLGSCFVENIGQKLEYFKFPVLTNPFGILFHPAAMLNIIKRAGREILFQEQDVFCHNEVWRSFEAHSKLGAASKEELLAQLNSAVEATHDHLQQATHIIMTPGTAWAYRLKETGKIVANCHKLAQQNFTKELTGVKNDLLESVSIIQKLNPEANIIFTVSPVRHLKDGFMENQQSKAKLITAVHEIIAETSGVSYFPAYEIMMDELRDYRFYAEDMLHPNKVAIDHIWKRFSESAISSEAHQLMKRIEVIQKGLAHRPFNEASAAHQKFKKDLQRKIGELQQEHPRITF